MLRYFILPILFTTFSLGDAYSKYGRSCQDIGCPNNEVCVMEEDPCSIYARNECGRYPTCKRVSNERATCATFVCPPSQSCRIDHGEPKCFEDPSLTGSKHNTQPVQNYNPGSPSGHNNPSAPVYPNPAQPQNPYNQQYPQNPQYPQYPQYPPTPSSRLYPNVPQGINGHTTPRPNVYQPGQQVGSRGGYQGGSVGSGYPGQQQQGGYPGQQQQGGYPGYAQPGNYPRQQGNAYPNQGYGQYPGQPYPTQRGGSVPSRGGYPQQGYGQSGYNQQGNNNKNGQDGFFDKVGDTLKTIGLFWLFLKLIISRTYQLLE